MFSLCTNYLQQFAQPIRLSLLSNLNILHIFQDTSRPAKQNKMHVIQRPPTCCIL
jgi:hypothetical protein